MSSEQPPGVPSSETGADTNPGYTAFLNRARADLERRPEMRHVTDWYKERLAGLPDMKLLPAPASGEGGYAHEMAADGKLKKITGGYFDIDGNFVDTGLRDVDGKPKGWVQIGIKQKEVEVSFPTPNGQEKMKSSGFVGVIRDRDGNILISLGQEPYAHTTKKGMLRTPYQTSAAKMMGILEGNRDLDPGLSDALNIIGRGKSPFQMFESGDFVPFPLAPADPGRIDATNIGFMHTVRDSDIREKLTAGGRNRWCKPEEIKALNRAGLVNGHTAAAVLAVI